MSSSDVFRSAIIAQLANFFNACFLPEYLIFVAVNANVSRGNDSHLIQQNIYYGVGVFHGLYIPFGTWG